MSAIVAVVAAVEAPTIRLDELIGKLDTEAERSGVAGTRAFSSMRERWLGGEGGGGCVRSLALDRRSAFLRWCFCFRP